ncbi:MAG: hypothetical protein AAGI52_12745 [Bacteroidota bacterium]
MRFVLTFFLALSLVACDDGLAKPTDRESTARAETASERLAATEAGQRVLDAIEAHGGLAAWYSAGPIAFRYAYTRLDSTGAPDTTRPPLDTRQVIDTWSARAEHTLVADSTVRFGWTGTEAWAMPTAEAVPTDPRFWSLTPYYFIAMPFVLADPGVNLEMAEPLVLDSTTTVDQVYVTFDSGTGDAPDDYYYLLLDPETSEVRGVRYVVSYGPFNPDGGHTPETIMLYDGAQTIGGITLQEGFRSFAWDGTGPGAPKAQGTLTDIAFRPEMADVEFSVPEGAEVQPDLAP